jgi:DNA-binding transcriptional LysR family regulator
MSAVDGRAVWRLLGPNGGTYDFQHHPRCIADDLLTLKLAVLGGNGVSLLPDYMCRDEMLDGRLVRALSGWAPRPGIFHAVYPSRRGLIPAVRRFLDFLGEAIMQEGLPHPAMKSP